METFLELYLSSFWSWVGITIGAWVVLVGSALVVAVIMGRK